MNDIFVQKPPTDNKNFIRLVVTVMGMLFILKD